MMIKKGYSHVRLLIKLNQMLPKSVTPPLWSTTKKFFSNPTSTLTQNRIWTSMRNASSLFPDRLTESGEGHWRKRWGWNIYLCKRSSLLFGRVAPHPPFYLPILHSRLHHFYFCTSELPQNSQSVYFPALLAFSSEQHHLIVLQLSGRQQVRGRARQPSWAEASSCWLLLAVCLPVLTWSFISASQHSSDRQRNHPCRSGDIPRPTLVLSQKNKHLSDQLAVMECLILTSFPTEKLQP